jgi:hypothetical protein
MAKGKKTGGRAKGTPNKTTALLKDAILDAGKRAGGRGGLTAYLEDQAIKNPGPFMSLLGKVLPTQVTGDGGGPIEVVTKTQRDAAVAAALRADR